MKWISTKESLPGFDKKVFVYCEHSGEIDGPVILIEHEATEIIERKGFEQNMSTGERFDTFKGSGIYACAWFKRGLIFRGFMPTHWIGFPELPEIMNSND